MKKRIGTLLLAATMVLSLAACGGSETPASESSREAAPSSSTASSAPVSSSTATSEAVSEEEESEEVVADDDISNWTCYMGVMDDGSTVYYAYHPEGTRGAFLVLSPDFTSSISIIGDCGHDEETGIDYITDDATGITITDITTDNGDGTYTVDYGDLGTAVIADADPQEVIDAMDTIQAGTTDVTAEFVASMGMDTVTPTDNVTAADVDVSGWSCYVGVMDDASTVYYAYSPDGASAIFIVLSSDMTSSISVMGDYVFDEAEGIGYITDETTGLTIADVTIDNGDGTYTVDYGDLGTAIIAPEDPQVVIEAMDTIQSGTTDITEEFIASLG